MTIPVEPAGREIPRFCNDSHLQLAKSKGKGRGYKVTTKPVIGPNKMSSRLSKETTRIANHHDDYHDNS